MILAAEHRRTRWKNGGGETREIAIAPHGASVDDFDWRLSIATVAGDGPFSCFPGIDRTLCILDGAGVRLTIDDADPLTVGREDAPLAFRGESAIHSVLIDGSVTDFNVMTRREAYSHEVARSTLGTNDSLLIPGEVTAVFCAAGSIAVTMPDGSVATLSPEDTLLAGGTAVTARSAAGATLLLVTIRGVNHA